ncbi:hypothetical protein [Roseiterribacter gracilis]|uniref:Uncharacterized protein n=1 Tax=Roseiterribacter gracilis TaxID=2812848 RepID=A0A8S8XC75_9PROT|nr:hypothetical protein TMPK1_14960 [Rhodospirillales bacterium TMPK1]
MSRIYAALLLALGLTAPAAAMGEGAVRLQPGTCAGEVHGIVAQGSLRTRGDAIRGLPAGVKLVGQCQVVGSGNERSFMILWSVIDTGPLLRPSRLNGAPFGTSVVPVKCSEANCPTPQLPDTDIPIELRQPMPRLWDGGSA